MRFGALIDHGKVLVFSKQETVPLSIRFKIGFVHLEVICRALGKHFARFLLSRYN